MRTTLLVLLGLAALPALAAPMPAAEVDRGIALDRSCITQAERQIATQREIGEVSGVYDRRVLYVAGMNKVQCRKHLAKLQACKAAGSCQPDTHAEMAATVTEIPPNESGLP